jgi:hypothetical protein
MAPTSVITVLRCHPSSPKPTSPELVLTLTSYRLLHSDRTGLPSLICLSFVGGPPSSAWSYGWQRCFLRSRGGRRLRATGRPRDSSPAPHANASGARHPELDRPRAEPDAEERSIAHERDAHGRTVFGCSASRVTSLESVRHARHVLLSHAQGPHGHRRTRLRPAGEDFGSQGVALHCNLNRSTFVCRTLV